MMDSYGACVCFALAVFFEKETFGHMQCMQASVLFTLLQIHGGLSINYIVDINH